MKYTLSSATKIGCKIKMKTPTISKLLRIGHQKSYVKIETYPLLEFTNESFTMSMSPWKRNESKRQVKMREEEKRDGNGQKDDEKSREYKKNRTM